MGRQCLNVFLQIVSAKFSLKVLDHRLSVGFLRLVHMNDYFFGVGGVVSRLVDILLFPFQRCGLRKIFEYLRQRFVAESGSVSVLFSGVIMKFYVDVEMSLDAFEYGFECGIAKDELSFFPGGAFVHIDHGSGVCSGGRGIIEAFARSEFVRGCVVG